MMLKEHVRDACHRIAEIVGGLTPMADYEIDAALTGIFDALLAAQRERDAQAIQLECDQRGEPWLGEVLAAALRSG